MTDRRRLERARTVRIEDEIARRGIRLKGRIDRCGPCPVCGGHDRFAINVRKQCFICRGCGIAGDVIKLVQHLDNCAFVSAVETLFGDDVRPQASPPAKKQISDDYEREQHRKAAWWVAGAAGRMPALAETLPGYIESVTICAHADKAGQDGALALADALDRRGVEVFTEGVQ